jgi:cell wall-associated NlpC family hydrolase
MPVSGKGLAAVAAGSLFVWSGVKGWSVMGLAQDLLTGKQPTQPVANSIEAPDKGTPNATPSGDVSGLFEEATIAGTALFYRNHAYQFGGAPGADGSKPWDCSSFVNFVCGVKLGLPIPGYGPGKYKGDVHGPPCLSWGAWNGIDSIPQSSVASGDLVIWSNHMGIAVSNTQMISALNPKETTIVTDIQGHGNGPLLRYGRYRIGPNNGSGQGGGGGDSW